VHGPSPDADVRWLAAAGALIVAFMVGEVAAGLVAHSLALLSDAAHMLTDAAAIGLAIVTAKIAGRPARGGYTYGLRRLEILSAQANGITLVLLALWLAYEAIRRLITPHPVTGALMLSVALAGVCVNLAASWLLARANGASARRSLNMEGAVAHVLTDLYAFAATAIAAVIILATGFARADAIATLVVVALMLRAGSGLIRESGRIFLEAAPADIDPAALGAAMAARPHVAEVHDLHIWEITTGMPAASAHVLVEPHQDCHAVRADLEALLAREHGITHLTLQVDHAPDPVDLPAPSAPDRGHDHAAPPAHPRDHDHAGHSADGHGHGAPADRDHNHAALATDGHDNLFAGTRTPGHDHGHPAEDTLASGRPAKRKPADSHPASHDAEENHAPGPPHCEDSHGPAYRPTHNPR
jgi:cobalt-zinc-cadmium efflux system protein